MKLIDKVIASLALCLLVCTLGIVTQLAIPTNAAAAPQGVELPIMMYHHILKEEARLNKYTISPTEFRTDMQYLKDNGYTSIVMQDLIDFTQGGTPLPEKPIMITFDDGYESFHEYAFPILQEFEYTAVFSVVGRYADEYSKVDDHHIRYSHCTWDQLIQMQKSGLVEIQNHSYNLHQNENGRHGSKMKQGENLAFYRKMLEEDLGKLQQACQAQLGITPNTFTYPFGQISAEALPIIKDLGFVGALTCQEKLNYITGDPEQLFHLNRFNRPHGKSLQTILENARQK